MSNDFHVSGYKTFGYHTETAATLIDEAVPGVDNKTLALINFEYLAAATAHDISFMYAQGTGTRITCPLGAAISQKDVVCSVAPKDPAGNATAASDIIAYQVDGGGWEFNTVASLASLTITLTTNIATKINAGGKVRIFGIVADGALFNVHAIASVVTTLGKGNVAIVHPFIGDPFYVSSTNATNDGFLNNMLFAYQNKNGGGAT